MGLPKLKLVAGERVDVGSCTGEVGLYVSDVRPYVGAKVGDVGVYVGEVGEKSRGNSEKTGDVGVYCGDVGA